MNKLLFLAALGLGALIAASGVGCSDDGTADTDPSTSSTTTTTSSSTGGNPTCPTGQQFCNGDCTLLQIDPDNCGVCGVRCPIGQVCSLGACGTDCAGGTSKCGDLCVNLMSDQQNCGACGKACPAGQVCDGAGTCKLSCPAETQDCSGACIDTKTSQQHCGTCGNACSGGQVCDGTGNCSTSCATDRINCDGACIDPKTDEAFCGASGNCTGGNAGDVCSDAENCQNGVCMAVVCNDQFEPTASSNNTEATATALSPEPVSDCTDPLVVTGVINSGSDVDWYRYEGSDDLGCVVSPKRSFKQINNAARLCAFFQCLDEDASTQFTCPAGTTGATSPGGRFGCCATGSTAAFEVDDVNCTGTFSDDFNVFIRVDDPAGNSGTCTAYTLEYSL